MIVSLTYGQSPEKAKREPCGDLGVAGRGNTKQILRPDSKNEKGEKASMTKEG